MDRKPYVMIQGRSNVGLPGGNGNKEKETNVKSFQKQNQ